MYYRHWSESVYQTELMTGWFYTNIAPLSRMTVRSLQDLGYVVAPDRADSYVVPGQRRRRRLRLPDHRLLQESNRMAVGEDMLTGPFHQIQTIPKPGRAVVYPKQNAFWESLLVD